MKSKLIIPYLLLSIILAIIGTYIITRLVTSSIRERFVNQLYEASRVAADSIARRERLHLEHLRLIAYTEGFAEALQKRDNVALSDFVLPIMLNSQIEIFTMLDTQGREILSLGLDPLSRQYTESSGVDFSTFEPAAKALQEVVDERGDKFVGWLDSQHGRAFFTSSPVKDERDNLTGALLVGTYANTILSEAKAQALADIIVLDEDYHLIATTLVLSSEIEQILESTAQTTPDKDPSLPVPITLYGRDYQVTFSPFLTRGEQLGWMGVVLPSSYVVSAEATSRNIFSITFTLGAAVVIVIGYLLAQSIAYPLLKLRSLSQDVASGNLDQVIGLQRVDEIGDLANAFDQMTFQLRERTEEAARLYAESVQRNKELAAMNVQLQATQAQLIQAEKLAAVGQLTAGIVHDVKNPLTVIKGLAELLLDSEISPETGQSLKVIRESADKANNIVSDLLKFARQSPLEKNYQDIRDSIEAVIRLTAYLARKAKVQVIKDLPDHPVYLAYDAQQIEQVFFNIVNNAFQAMSEPGTLRVTLRHTDNVAAIAFQDTGVGIPAENLTRIFDPFFTTKPAGQGTGLGLSVSYGIITSHEGQIQVESIVGKGTTFTILLPTDQEPGIEI